MVLFKITRPKDREFVVKGMITGTKDHEIRVATVVLSTVNQVLVYLAAIKFARCINF